MSNVDRWKPWYDGATVQQHYGDPVIYEHAAEFFDGLPVEDWGCGYGYFANVHNGEYRGVDGTMTRWCDEQVDLTSYRSTGWNVLLRGVLEHNYQWPLVLDNAVASFDQRLLVVLFTPLQDHTTRVLAENVGGLGVPDIGFRLGDLVSHLGNVPYTVETVPAQSGYDNVEVLLKVTR